MLDKREWLGLLLAPAPLALAIPFYDWLQLGNGLGKGEVVFAFLVFGYPMVIAFGIAIHLLLRRFGRWDAGSYLVAAAAIGGLVGLIPVLSNWLSPPDPRNPFALRIAPAIPIATTILGAAFRRDLLVDGGSGPAPHLSPTQPDPDRARGNRRPTRPLRGSAPLRDPMPQFGLSRIVSRTAGRSAPGWYKVA